MNRVEISSTESLEPLPWMHKLESFALLILEKLEKNNWDISILLCDDETICQLNAEYRNKNEPTDVLSFELGETVEEDGEKRFLAGDIVISLQTLYENAHYFSVEPDEEFRRLVIHGILHLSGMDHQTNDASEPMLQFQELLLEQTKEEHILL
ncbi:MAG: rRNA maturation RNase YbeY [Treponema sp.]|nr:rRNA maturation RNase YbeY [Treponema sp.]